MRLEPPDLICTSDLARLKCFATSVISSSFALPSTGGDLSWAIHVPSSLCSSRLARELGLTFIWMVISVIPALHCCRFRPSPFDLLSRKFDLPTTTKEGSER